MIAFVHSRTCVTLPGEELRSVKFIVWIESIITMSGFFRADMLHNELYIRFSKHTQVWAGHTEPHRTQLDLPGGFLTGNIQNPQMLPEILTDLQEDCRFADAGITADQNQRALDNPTAKHAIELGKTGMVTMLVLCIDFLDRLRARKKRRSRISRNGSFRRCSRFDRLLHRVPLAAIRTFSRPFRAFKAAI